MNKLIRKYDIILYGCTGFTGKIIIDYLLNRNYNNNKNNQIKIGLSGRNLLKIENILNDINILNINENYSMKNNNNNNVDDDLMNSFKYYYNNIYIDIVIANSSNFNSLLNMTKQTNVILSTVGPYTLYGTPLIEACIDTNTNYVDLTGEPLWVNDLINKYHEICKEKSLKIVNCCGFDSIPSDIGTYYLINKYHEKYNKYPTHVDHCWLAVKGAFSGGTLATIITICDLIKNNPSEGKKASDPYLLNDKNSNIKYKKITDQSFVRYNKYFRTWTNPFLMAGINSKIVRRSLSLFNLNITYHESWSQKGFIKGFLKSLIYSIFLPIGFLILFFNFTRNIALKFLPSIGEGPSEEVRKNGMFKSRFIAIDENNLNDKLTLDLIDMNGDPGYQETAKIISESALCLALDKNLPENYGIVTPATAMGDSLVERLQEQDIIMRSY